jgi:hypothetical protein
MVSCKNLPHRHTNVWKEDNMERFVEVGEVLMMRR